MGAQESVVIFNSTSTVFSFSFSLGGVIVVYQWP